MRKKRIEKKVEKLRRKKIHDVLEMVLEINGTHPRKLEKTGDKPTAFFDFYGHVASVDVKVCTDGWGNEKHPVFSSYGYLDTYNSGREMEKLQKELEEVMEKLRDDGKM